MHISCRPADRCHLMRMGRIFDAAVRKGRANVDRVVSADRYARQMAWKAEDRERWFPDVQRGWELIGVTVKRRRFAIRWSQRDLERASGVDQTVISRLENGRLSGLRFSRFARLVAAMNGLDPEAPHPPLRAWHHLN
jgi:DNA-binding Xre family transcriptional regulator